MSSTTTHSHKRRRRNRRDQSWWGLSAAADEPVSLPPESQGQSRSKRHRHTSRRLSKVFALIIGLVGMLAGFGVSKLISRTPPTPVFTRLTFARGIVRAARFADEGAAVVYSAAWDGGPVRLYMTRPSVSEATLLDLPPGHLLSTSASEELAVSLDHAFDGELGLGTLARAPLRGSGASRLLDNVREAAFTPDGSVLAVVRRVRNRDQLEWPVGNLLYSTNGYLSDLRFSGDGKRLAFGEHAVYTSDEGDIVVIDNEGTKGALVTSLHDIRGIAWSPVLDELWFSAGSDDPQAFATLQSISMTGRRRTVLAQPIDLRLMDIDPSGRVLLSGETRIPHIEALLPGEGAPRDWSLVDASMARAISDEGKEVLITRDTDPNVVLRKADGKMAQVGDGEGLDLSNDGKWALVVTDPPRRLVMFATRTGEVKQLPNPANLAIVDAKLLPDAENIVLLGGRAGDPWSAYLQNVKSGALTRFTRPGVTFLPSRTMVLSSDGQQVALVDQEGRVRLFPVAGGDPKPITGLAAGEFPLRWSQDAASVFVTRGTSPPWRVERLNVNTGERTPWREVTTMSTAGIASSRLRMSSDGGVIVHSYSQVLSNLYIVDGLR